jgi:type IV secretory pathway VirB2 component (pilin)
VNRRGPLVNVAIVFAICFIGAMLMTGFDHGVTGLLKFFGYLIFFASISSPALFSSHHSFSAMLRRLRKQS